MTKRSKAPARALALLALVSGFVVLVVVVSAALSGDSSDGGASSESAPKTRSKPAPSKKAPKTYVIENGDTLTAIARRTGVPVAKIERLNPDVDPQILISGEKLKLR